MQGVVKLALALAISISVSVVAVEAQVSRRAQDDFVPAMNTRCSEFSLPLLLVCFIFFCSFLVFRAMIVTRGAAGARLAARDSVPY